MELIYLDSCLVIHLVERHPEFGAKVRTHLAAAHDARFAVSALTRLEVLTGPLRNQDKALVTRFEVFLAAHRMLPINDLVVNEALALRVAGLKTPDALHMALAQHHGCTALWTNDDRLAKILPGFSRNLVRDS